jgi:glycosyltransferase involved in cell wall biosynthesis
MPDNITLKPHISMQKKSKKPTVTIGIAAYNEEQSFPNFIELLLKQSTKEFILQKIIVVSDGSSDKTVKKIRKIKNKKIIVKDSCKRKGKPSRLNQLMQLSHSDILVLLDADLQIRDIDMIDRLIQPMRKNKNIAGVSGATVPMEPQTIVQKIVYTGIQLWMATLHSVKNTNAYLSTGAVRAFRKKFYKEIVFPKISADDIYPYLYCMSRKYTFRIIPQAKVYYGLPSTYRDYFYQMKRYLKAESLQSTQFSEKIMKKAFVVTQKDRIRILIKEGLKNPFWVGLYALFLIPPHFITFLEKGSNDRVQWKMILTSKVM